MARRISFAMTIPQFLGGTKTVTRRMGFTNVRIGDEMIAVEKCMGLRKGVVMDGRDIGTVVLPDAELKVFMTATLEARAKRRWDELHERGMKLSIDEVKANLEHRDLIDSTRADSPLTKAADAILLDTSEMTVEEQTKWLIAQAEAVIQS